MAAHASVEGGSPPDIVGPSVYFFPPMHDPHIGSARLQAGYGSSNLTPHDVFPVVGSRRCFMPLCEIQIGLGAGTAPSCHGGPQSGRWMAENVVGWRPYFQTRVGRRRNGGIRIASHSRSLVRFVNAT